MSIQIISPVTHSSNVSFVEQIPAQHIINLYAQLGIDVHSYFKDIAYISIYKCEDSGLKFYAPSGIDGDAKFYEALEKVYPGYYNPWKWEHEQIIPYVTKGMSVLEIGCAHGAFLEACTLKGVAKAVGLELNDYAVQEAKKKNIDVRNESVDEHVKTNRDSYDLITSFQVVEHIADLKLFLEHSIACLKPGGYYVISVPNNDCYLFKYDKDHTLNLPPHHMGLWEEGSLVKLASLLNLEIKQIYKQPSQASNYGMYYEVFLRKRIGLKGALLKYALKTTRPIVKFCMRFFPPKYGVCISIVYQKK